MEICGSSGLGTLLVFLWADAFFRNGLGGKPRVCCLFVAHTQALPRANQTVVLVPLWFPVGTPRIRAAFPHALPKRFAKRCAGRCPKALVSMIAGKTLTRDSRFCVVKHAGEGVEFVGYPKT